MTFQVNNKQVSELLRIAIENQVDAEGWEWIKQQETKISEQFKLSSFYLTFSAAARYINKEKLQVSKEQSAEANKLREGFQPENWNLLQAVRIYFLLQLPTEDQDSYMTGLTNLFETGDVEEQITLYSALPLLSYPELLKHRAAEGVRTNITDVFDAIALHNPFPHDHFEENAWNQMLLKAVFMRRPLYRIYGADERANPDLAGMLVDYAHERWAAGRKVIPELWRFVGPFLTEDRVSDIETVLAGDPLEKKAGLLSCADSDLPQAQELLNNYPELKKEIHDGNLTWNILGKEAHTEV